MSTSNKTGTNIDVADRLLTILNIMDIQPVTEDSQMVYEMINKLYNDLLPKEESDDSTILKANG